MIAEMEIQEICKNGNDSDTSKSPPPCVVGDKESEKPAKLMTPRKIKILASVVYGNLFLGSCYSLMAPFFPKEAELKGATASQYGFVFGVYPLVMVVTAPIYGKLAPKLKPGFLLKGGMLVSGVCVILFGTLTFAPAGTPFIALAFTVRIIDAFGASAFLTASYTVLGCELPDFIGRAVSVTETSFAVGLAGGPVLGGILYQSGGFSAPFAVVGSFLLLGTVVNFFLFSETDKNDPENAASAKKMLSDLDFVINIMNNFSCFFLLGFNEATLEPHIREFNLSPAAVGGIFLISGVLDAITAPICGFFAEKMRNAQHLAFVGCVLFVIVFLIVGPVPFLHFPTQLWVVILAQVLLGLAMAIVIVSSFTHGMKETVERGFPDDVSTYSMVSGLLFSCACLGAFLGPSFGGMLIDRLGYKYTTVIVVAFQAIVTILTGIRLLWLFIQKNRKPELISVMT